MFAMVFYLLSPWLPEPQTRVIRALSGFMLGSTLSIVLREVAVRFGEFRGVSEFGFIPVRTRALCRSDSSGLAMFCASASSRAEAGALILGYQKSVANLSPA
jgi:hypothetical protein